MRADMRIIARTAPVFYPLGFWKNVSHPAIINAYLALNRSRRSNSSSSASAARKHNSRGRSTKKRSTRTRGVPDTLNYRRRLCFSCFRSVSYSCKKDEDRSCAVFTYMRFDDRVGWRCVTHSFTRTYVKEKSLNMVYRMIRACNDSMWWNSSRRLRALLYATLFTLTSFILFCRNN